MKNIMLLISLVTLLYAGDYVVQIQKDETDFSMIVTVMSDDSTFIKTERTDTASVRNGFYYLNFGPCDNELTYDWTYFYEGDSSAEEQFSTFHSQYFTTELGLGW